MRVAILTASTAIYREQEEDKGGQAIKKIAEKNGDQIVFMKAVPNDIKVLSTIMQRIADGKLADLILTTGGAGCAPEDDGCCGPPGSGDSGGHAGLHDVFDKTFHAEPLCGGNQGRRADCEPSGQGRGGKSRAGVSSSGDFPCGGSD